jgi:hypothetical protein
MKFIYINGRSFFAALALLTILGTAVSCKKFVTVPTTAAKVDGAEAFQSNAAAIGLMTGVYANATRNSEGYFPYLSIGAGLSADELTAYGIGSPVNTALYSNNLTNTFTYFWSEFYSYIYVTNQILEGIAGPNKLSPQVITRLSGEAKFTRALFYYYLVTLHGDVPIVTATDYTQNEQKPRSPAAQVYQLIISDLRDAEGFLGADYTNADLTAVSTTSRLRPNKWAAAALLARVYLQTGDYPNAIAEATKVISQTNTYQLETLNNVFLATSKEAILQFQPTANSSWNTYDATVFILTTPPSYSKPVSLSNMLYSSFEAGDSRRSSWVGSFQSGATTYYFPYKYKVRNTSSATIPLTEDQMILRLAEQYLIRAEASIQNGNIAGGIADLNTIRARARAVANAGVPDPLPALSSTLSKNDALLALEHERQIELFTESGDRWLTIKRLKGLSNPGISRADEIMPAITTAKGGIWSTNAQLYPISLTEMKNDNQLIQNPGY